MGQISASQTSLLADPFWLRIIATDHHILADACVEFPHDRYSELKIYIKELILDSDEYIEITYVTMHCKI